MLLNQEILDEIRNQDYAAITDRIESFLIDKVKKSGSKGLIFGLSGGIDSTVLAYICKRNLKEKTIAIIMPDTSITPSSETKDAMRVISLTGIEHKLIDIKPIVTEYGMYLEPDKRARGNLRARVRANILYYYANAKNRLVLGSSDKSEYNIGYFTKYGDGASDIAPIISLYKLQVRGIAEYLQVPENIISKKSSPHLWEDHEAESELGTTYEEIDSALLCLIDKKMTVAETARKTEIDEATVNKIYQSHKNSQHKRLQPQRHQQEVK